MGKKEEERACLTRAMEIGMRRKGETKRIMKRLEGVELPRKEPEGPDFVKVTSPTQRGDKGALVGIEHFCVDHYSEPMRKNDGKTANSLGSKMRANMSATFEKGHKALIETGELTEEALSGVASIVSENLAAMKKSSYYSFLHSFECSMNKHLDKTDEYRSRLKALANEGQRVELAFLIEVHSDFSNMFLRDGKEVHKCPRGFMPMFEDVVSLLEKTSGRVDRIILVMGATVHDEETSVLALNCQNVKGSLKKQRVRTYEYVGEDRFLPEMRTIAREVEASSSYEYDGINLYIDLECTGVEAAPECRVDAAFQGLKQVHEASLDGRSCACTFAVHFLSEIFIDGIICWPQEQIGPYPNIPRVRMNPGELNSKFLAFAKNWLEE